MAEPIDERTPSQQLALPHPRNRLEQDVLRLRQSLLAIDAALQARDGNLATAVNAMQQIANDLGNSINALQMNKVGVVNGLPGPAVTLKPAHLGLGPANGPSALALQRDGTGRVSQVATTVGGKACTQALAYDGQGRVATVTTIYDGRTRTETYTYTPQGRVASMAATEIQA